MGDAKQIVVRPITAQEARATVQRIHYSGKVVQNSTLHLGVFWLGKLEGAMQFGSPLDRRKVLPLVRGSEWNQMLELNRMAFSEALPRNSESRALAVTFRMFRKHRPDIKWILSFADGTQCGDGTIYRAAGFVLTGIKENDGMFDVPGFGLLQRMTLEPARMTPVQAEIRKNLNMPTQPAAALVAALGGRPLSGYQFRYLAFLDPTWRDRLTVPVIPFDSIPAAARMYRGKRASPERGPGVHPGTGGVDPRPWRSSLRGRPMADTFAAQSFARLTLAGHRRPQ